MPKHVFVFVYMDNSTQLQNLNMKHNWHPQSVTKFDSRGTISIIFFVQFKIILSRHVVQFLGKPISTIPTNCVREYTYRIHSRRAEYLLIFFNNQLSNPDDKSRDFYCFILKKKEHKRRAKKNKLTNDLGQCVLWYADYSIIRWAECNWEIVNHSFGKLLTDCC